MNTNRTDQPNGLVIYMDREGDVWRAAGRTPEGVELLTCPAPRESDDIGEPGPTDWAWTRPVVESWHGPLVPVTPDAVQAELAAVDAALHEVFGRDESGWTEEQTQQYLAGVDAVHARFDAARTVAA